MKTEPEFEKYRPLLTGLLDGELTAEEAADVNDAMIKSSALREEYEGLCSSDEELKHLSMMEPGDEVARRLWKSPFNRFVTAGGVWLIVIGYLTLIIYSFNELATNSGELNLPKVAVFAIWAGIATLFLTVLRERIATYKTDPYKDVER